MENKELSRDGIDIIISDTEIVIDGVRYPDLEENPQELEDYLSEYFFFDFWDEVIFQESEGELSPDSMFLFYLDSPPMPCCTEINKHTYFSNPKYAAGFLKHIILKAIAEVHILTTEQIKELCNIPPEIELHEVYYNIDIEEVIDMYSDKESDKTGILDKIIHVNKLCNQVFAAQDKDRAVAALKLAADVFNEYFTNGIVEQTGYNYIFEIFDNAKSAKASILEGVYMPEEKKALGAILDATTWTSDECKLLDEAIADWV